MNLGALLERTAVRYPDHIAWGEVTYRTVDERVNRLANALVAAGIAPGDRVGTRLWNCPEGIEIMFAVWRAGAVLVPLNSRLLDGEATPLIIDAGCKLLFRDGPFTGDVAGLRSIELATEYEAFLGTGAPTNELPRPAQDDLAWIIFTSGTTTGTPKGAMLTHRNLLAMVASNTIEVVHPNPATDAVLHVIPLSFAGGFFLLHHIAKGVRNVFLPSRNFDPEVVLDVMERERVTSVVLITTLINPLVETKRPRPTHLHTVFYGGAAAAPDRLASYREAWGPVFVHGYGLVEVCAGISTLKREEHVGPLLHSVGRPNTLMDVKIVDGEIAVRGDLVMRGYWNRPEATAAAIRDGGFYTGDVGHLDDAGYLYLTDRKKDIIKSGGATVSPSEVEAAIYKHPAVLETIVFGIPDAKWGEAVTALVVLRPGATATEAEIIDTCRQHIAAYKRPQSVAFLPEFPKGGNAKIERRELREQYLATKQKDPRR